MALSKLKLAAGQRDKHVTIETRTAAQANSGYPTDTWATLARAYMSREDARADERVMASMDSAYVETRWQMLYMEAMDPEIVDVPATKRLRYRDRYYNILAASLMDQRMGIELLTLAQVG